MYEEKEKFFEDLLKKIKKCKTMRGWDLFAKFCKKCMRWWKIVLVANFIGKCKNARIMGLFAKKI